jgi:anaerobic ribonucleoside-triphosphate reductase activating protein
VQGCSIRCPGCINPQLFSFDGGHEVDSELLIEEAIVAGVEGITLLGGEPFDQPDEVAAIAQKAQTNGLGVITFTGYSVENLRGDDRMHSLLSATDLLIDGPYEKDSPEQRRALVGSSNQRFIYLSNRYKGYEPEHARNRIELRIQADGSVEMAGFLTTTDARTFTSQISTRKIRRKHLSD